MVLSALLLISVPLPSGAAYDVYVNVEGIPGESLVEGYKEWIDALGFRHVVQRDVAPTTGIPAEQPVFEPLEFTKHLDRATPKLNHACAAATMIPRVTLAVVVGPPDRPELLYKIVLENVFVVGVEIEAKPATDGSGPVEKVQLVFNRIRWEYTPPRGSPGGIAPIVEEWRPPRDR